MPEQSTQPTPPPKPLAREIVALNDAELRRYLEEHDRVVSVQDPQNLPESFMERLRDFARHPKGAYTIDLDQVNARLLEPSPPRSGSSSRVTTSPEPIEDVERRNYAELVRLGGRPAYPISMLDDVIQDARKHRDATKYADMLAHFFRWTVDYECPSVFSVQLARWDEFCTWQDRIRGIRGGERHMYFGAAPALYNFKKTWNDESLGAYAEAAKYTALEPNGLASLPFCPLQDKALQDPLTTWLEYIVLKHWVAVYCAERAKTGKGIHHPIIWQGSAENHSKELPWAIRQVLLIQAEMRSATAQGGRPPPRRSQRIANQRKTEMPPDIKIARKRRRTGEQEEKAGVEAPVPERGSKRRRTGEQREATKGTEAPQVPKVGRGRKPRRTGQQQEAKEGAEAPPVPGAGRKRRRQEAEATEVEAPAPEAGRKRRRTDQRRVAEATRLRQENPAERVRAHGQTRQTAEDAHAVGGHGRQNLPVG